MSQSPHHPVVTSLVGTIARRVAVAVAGALGVQAASVEEPINAILLGLASVVIVTVSEWFSQRHNRALKNGIK